MKAGSTTLAERPRYGYVAIKYFLGIGVIGILGLLLAVFSIVLGGTSILWLLVIGIIIAFIGIYTAVAYIPLYFRMLRPSKMAAFWRELAREEELKGPLKALDVGCGTGGVAIRIAQAVPESSVIGIDIFQGVSGSSPEQPRFNAAAENVEDRVAFQEGNLLAIPFPENSFDIVTAGSVLHEIKGDENKLKALNEIWRVLKPSGKFITVEIVRNRRMYLAFLLFSFVWKPESFWSSLFQKSRLKLLRSGKKLRFLDLGVFVLQK